MTTNARELAELATAYAGGNYGMRNRIINGDMRIDQRNAGASVTVNAANSVYSVDRFFGFGTASAGVFTLQQSSVVPAGFNNSIVATVTTASTPSTGQSYTLLQHIEGFNIADFGFGTANAQTITLSFWVRSSLTGTFGGSLRNDGANRAYPFSYTISSANTWEQKTITIPGDTTGTWATNNSIGIRLAFSLGAGADRLGTPGSWTSNGFSGATGQTNLISTSGATFYITGVQLEAGSVATPFERRPYGTELALCQRYCLRGPSGAVGRWNSATSAEVAYGFPVDMRASPTVTHNATYVSSNLGVASVNITATALSGASTVRGTLLTLTGSGAATGGICGVSGNGAIFSAEL
jgi:hypothetical protein